MNEPKIAIYTRVSTEDQDLQKQVDQLIEYVERNYPNSNPELYKDESTGTNTDRSGYKRLMGRLEEYDVVVFRSVSRTSRSIRDLERTVDKFRESRTKLEYVNEPIDFDPKAENPYNKAMLQLLGVFAELEASMIQSRTKQAIQTMVKDGHKWGRAPFGFVKKDGELTPDEGFDQICATLQLVDEGELSKNKAASQLGTSRTTIRRALEDDDRRELYGLQKRQEVSSDVE